jgi:hypothetical protein
MKATITPADKIDFELTRDAQSTSISIVFPGELSMENIPRKSEYDIDPMCLVRCSEEPEEPEEEAP